MKRFIVHWKFTEEFASTLEPYANEMRRGSVFLADSAQDAERAFKSKDHSHRVFLGVRESSPDEDERAEYCRIELEAMDKAMENLKRGIVSEPVELDKCEE